MLTWEEPVIYTLALCKKFHVIKLKFWLTYSSIVNMIKLTKINGLTKLRTHSIIHSPPHSWELYRMTWSPVPFYLMYPTSNWLSHVTEFHLSHKENLKLNQFFFKFLIMLISYKYLMIASGFLIYNNPALSNICRNFIILFKLSFKLLSKTPEWTFLKLK